MDKKKVDEQVDDIIEDIVIDTDLQEDEKPESTGVKIVMSGETYEVPPEVAEAINAERQGMDRKLGENSEELGELRKYQRDSVTNVRDVQPTNGEENKGYDYETAIYDDANAAIKHLKNEIRTEIREEYMADQTQRESGTKFWDNFYREHQDLGRNEIRGDVQARIMNELPKYSSLPDTAATRARIADDTRTYFLGIAKSFGGAGDSGSNNYSEGAGNNGSTQAGTKEPEFVRKSTSEILKENRKKKREALEQNK